MTFDYAVHSDLLIHWTGRDIDEKHDPQWCDYGKSATSLKAEEAYTGRLLSILRHGLWMTPERETSFSFGSLNGTAPEVARTCFTELRLSLSRIHAGRYGRLGIGVKRPFAFNRGGRPVIYYGNERQRKLDVFLKHCVQSLTDRSLLHFFKPMHDGDKLTYDFYAESEWRILYGSELTGTEKVVDPRSDSHGAKFLANLPVEEQAKLQYLLPLDGWLSCIIYPSVATKNRARQNREIQEELKRIKTAVNDHGNLVEKGNWPAEFDLDLCRNF